MTYNIIDRFWAKVDVATPDECWLFTGTPSMRYGTLRRGLSGEGTVYAHRLSYEIHHGPIPAGMDVMHSCDVPRCVNPAHLYVGTHKDNMIDCSRKGRQNGAAKARRGELNRTALLTADDVRAIRADTTTATKVLAAHYGMSVSGMEKVRSGANWKHIH